MRRLKDVRKKETIITMILAVLFVPILSHADYFVVLRNGEVRSGPGTDHPIVDTVRGSEVFEVPSTFKSRRDATWIPIEWREVPRATEVKGWFQLSTKTEYTESGEIVEGWYLSTLENIRNVGPGEILYFIMEGEDGYCTVAAELRPNSPCWFESKLRIRRISQFGNQEKKELT